MSDEAATAPFISQHLQLSNWIVDDKSLGVEHSDGVIAGNIFTKRSVFFKGNSVTEIELWLETRVVLPTPSDLCKEFEIPSVNRKFSAVSDNDYTVTLGIASKPVIELNVDGNEDYKLPWSLDRDSLKKAVHFMTKGWLLILRIFKDHTMNSHIATAKTSENGFMLTVSSSFKPLRNRQVSIACEYIESGLFDVTIKSKTIKKKSIEELKPLIDNHINLTFMARCRELDARVSVMLAIITTPYLPK